MPNKIVYIRTTLFLLAIFSCRSLLSQDSIDDFEFFSDDESIIECKLTSDFKFIRKTKYNTKYQSAKLTIYFKTDSADVEVKIKARAHTRLKICYFPPLRIKFDKDDFPESSIANFNKLKLVTHCKAQPSYTQRLIEEYLVYKSYQLLTNYSFKVRLLRIKYVDTGSKTDPGWNYAFLIEDIDQLAVRNNAIEINTKTIHSEQTDRAISTFMSMFQFMIGNTDWAIPGLHNVKLVKSNDPNFPLPITVPYDFDYSGLLNAPYAIPHESLDLESVTDRRYQGFCRFTDEFREVLDIFLANKEAILNFFENNEILEKSTKHEANEYLEEFFAIAANRNAVDRIFLSQCVQMR